MAIHNDDGKKVLEEGSSGLPSGSRKFQVRVKKRSNGRYNNLRDFQIWSSKDQGQASHFPVLTGQNSDHICGNELRAWGLYSRASWGRSVFRSLPCVSVSLPLLLT